MSGPLFGPSRNAKSLDPALAGLTDEQLASRDGVPAWMPAEDVEAELAQRARNRELAGGAS